MPERCVVCDTTARIHELEVQTWSIVRCMNCGTRTLDPMPDEVHMDGFDDGSEYDLVEDLRDAIMAEHARTLATLGAIRRPGRLLDVGCGTGLFLRAARDAGWTATGIDPSKAAVDAAREDGFTVHHGLLEDAGFDRGSFDAISLMQVVEHLPDPRPLLQACRDLLVPGGVIVVATPNPASLLAARTGADFNYWIPPTHLAWYPPKALERLTIVAGFKPARTRTWSAHVPSLHDGRAVVDRTPLVRGLPYRARRILADTVVLVADRTHRGTIVEQFSVKP